ncbi:MAG TPA: thiol-disulfide oxidoreductase DCC family protein [Pseudoxanthomonas sp.]|nr:thiol-disulfide oxidoreductase DCC family protein [Pseudoxanthomonas sp.]
MSSKRTGSDTGPIIVFDGVCVLCNGWVRFLLKRDHGHYRFASMQSPAGRALLVSHGLDADDPSSFLLIEGGRAWTDTDAIGRVLSGLGGGWRIAALIGLIPRILRDPLYRMIARNRYRWFGTTACTVPTEAQRSRFLQ